MLVAYGLGDAGTGMAASLIGFYLFIFYTKAAGLAPWMAGLVLMLARLWDAINDPIIGWLSDKTRTPWGPRLPWILGTALPLGVAGFGTRELAAVAVLGLAGAAPDAAFATGLLYGVLGVLQGIAAAPLFLIRR